MTEGTNRKRILYPLGVTPEPDGVNILVQARGEEAFLLLYEPGAAEPCEKIAFPREDRMGDVWSMAGISDRGGWQNDCRSMCKKDHRTGNLGG